MPKHKLTKLLILIILLSGCASQKNRSTESIIIEVEKYTRQPVTSADSSEYLSSPSENKKPWWEFYENEDLNSLIEHALKNNPSLNQTKKRFEQAAARADITFSDLLPSADLSAERSTSRGKNKMPSMFSLRSAARYELDIWGKNQAAFHSDRLEAEATTEDIRASAITLSASIVENWIHLLSLREEEELLKSQITTNEMVLDLQHKRYANGASEALDVLQQQDVLERSRSGLPDIKLAQELIEHQLAILSGRPPSLPVSIQGNKLPEVLPLPDTGIPARLLNDRPDIIAAWLRVISADWATESARINRLPNIEISTNYSTTSTKFNNMFEVWFLDLALKLSMPLFDAGERAAEHSRQSALADERFQSYKETVLKALAEVEGALSRNHHQSNKIVALNQRLNVSRNTLEQAQISYANGDESYISVLNGLINVQSLEQQLVRERKNMALDRVELYRTIGLRSWTEQALDITEDVNG